MTVIDPIDAEPRPGPKHIGRLASVGWVLIVLIVGVVGGVVTAGWIQLKADLRDQETTSEIMAGDVDVLRMQLLGLGETPDVPAPEDRDDLPIPVDGKTGATGAAGLSGEDGEDGTDGAPGAPGPAGTNGADGVNGADGTQGPPGVQGEQGVQGPEGPEGPQGIPGPMPVSWTWSFDDDQWICNLVETNNYSCVPVVVTPPTEP
jgi:hypothetical protein